MVVAQAMSAMVRACAEHVMDTLGFAGMQGGIDLAREDRIEKCRLFHRATKDVFQRLADHVQRSQFQNRSMLQEYLAEVQYFVSREFQ
jgi:hypothetical protein